MHTFSSQARFNLIDSIQQHDRLSGSLATLTRTTLLLAAAALWSIPILPTADAQPVVSSPSNSIAQHHGTLSVLNQKNNEEQIDTSAEFVRAYTARYEKSADDLSGALSTVFQPIFPFLFSADGTISFFLRPGVRQDNIVREISFKSKTSLLRSLRAVLS